MMGLEGRGSDWDGGRRGRWGSCEAGESFLIDIDWNNAIDQ